MSSCKNYKWKPPEEYGIPFLFVKWGMVTLAHAAFHPSVITIPTYRVTIFHILCQSAFKKTHLSLMALLLLAPKHKKSQNVHNFSCRYALETFHFLSLFFKLIEIISHDLTSAADDFWKCFCCHCASVVCPGLIKVNSLQQQNRVFIMSLIWQK